MREAIDEAWLTTLPKVELHLHLEGSMSVETVARLVAEQGTNVLDTYPGGLPEAFSFVDFPDFIRQYLFGLSLLRTGEDIAGAVDDLATTLAGQNVRYAEITTTAYLHFQGFAGKPLLSPTEYRDGLDEGRRRAAAHGVEIGWVVDIPREIEPRDSTVTIDYLEGPHTPAGLVSIGLGGDEVGSPAESYAPQFARGRALGLHSVPHAGETEGAHSVRSAVDHLGAERIGHGVRSLEDPELVKELADRGILLEVCPTSNHLLHVVDSIEAHPLAALVDAGVRVSINTDDPGWFATDLVGELRIAAQLLDASPADVVALQADALAASFAPDDVRRRIQTELATVPT